jgi:hypothetical protein
MDSSCKGAVVWRGGTYDVEVTTTDGRPDVKVQPANEELTKACIENVQQNDGHLTVYLGYECNYLVNDPYKGKPVA